MTKPRGSAGPPEPAGSPASPDLRAARIAVNVAGVVQGIALVTFPAASAIFLSRADYGLSSSQYGLMFLPQVIAAIAAALLGGGLLAPTLLRRLSEKTVYLAGLVADLASMALLVASWGLAHTRPAGYLLLLAATACLGAGFGLTVPALNTLATAFRPDSPDRAVLVLNALLGLGTALAPAFVAVFTGLGFWVGLPVLVGVLLAGLVVFSLRLQLDPPAARAAPDLGPGRGAAGAGATVKAGPRLPAGFWLFGSAAFLYGLCETMNGNWAQPDLTAHGIRPATASLALTGFWAAVTAGRLLIAAVQCWLPSEVAYHLLPFVLAGVFVLIAVLPRQAPVVSIAAFCLAGLGCSALLPLTISFGQDRLAAASALASGGVIACYQAGYGAAAFGTGPLTSAGISLSAVFGAAAVVAVALGLLSLAVTRRRPSPPAVHP